MGDVHISLAAIEASMRRLARPTAALLKPGTDRGVARSTLVRRGFDAPTDLLSLWEWHNGTASQAGATVLGDMWLVPGFYLLSVEEAVARFDVLRLDRRWDRSWVPVLADDGGDYVAVQCGPAKGDGAVLRFRNDDAEVVLEYPSVERMAATFAAAYEQGAFYVDSEGWLEQDDAAFYGLAAQMNPEITWWREALT